MKAAFLVAAFLLLSYCAAAEIGGASGTFASESKSVSIIRANETAPFVYRHGDDLGIYEIRLTVNHEVKAPRIDLQKTMFGADVQLPVSPRNGSIYKVLFVVKSRQLNDSAITNAEIRFKVPKYWIKFNKISPDTVTLAMLNRTNWTNLATEKFAEDDGYFYFKTDVKNFSVYAIYGKKGVAQNLTLQSAADDANLAEDSSNMSGAPENKAASENDAEEAARAQESAETKQAAYFLSLRPEQKKGLVQNPSAISLIIAALLLACGLGLYALSSRRLRMWRIRVKWKLRRMRMAK